MLQDEHALEGVQYAHLPEFFLLVKPNGLDEHVAESHIPYPTPDSVWIGSMFTGFLMLLYK